MTTVTDHVISEEAARMGSNPDPEELTRIRDASDARFAERKARLDADEDLDPRIRALYLDRTICNTARAATELDVSENRIYDLRRATPRYPEPHPAAYPHLDTPAGSADTGVEIGRLREWAVQRGSHTMDPDTGRLSKVPGYRHGRPRSTRPTMGKPHLPKQHDGSETRETA